jgi:hypothetical protein
MQAVLQMQGIGFVGVSWGYHSPDLLRQRGRNGYIGRAMQNCLFLSSNIFHRQARVDGQVNEKIL